MKRPDPPRWADLLLAGWIVLVGLLYFAQFRSSLGVGLDILRRAWSR